MRNCRSCNKTIGDEHWYCDDCERRRCRNCGKMTNYTHDHCSRCEKKELLIYAQLQRDHFDAQDNGLQCSLCGKMPVGDPSQGCEHCLTLSDEELNLPDADLDEVKLDLVTVDPFAVTTFPQYSDTDLDEVKLDLVTVDPFAVTTFPQYSDTDLDEVKLDLVTIDPLAVTSFGQCSTTFTTSPPDQQACSPSVFYEPPKLGVLTVVANDETARRVGVQMAIRKSGVGWGELQSLVGQKKVFPDLPYGSYEVLVRTGDGTQHRLLSSTIGDSNRSPQVPAVFDGWTALRLRAKNSANQEIKNAQITVTLLGTVALPPVKTNPYGYADFGKVPAGKHLVRIEHSDYQIVNSEVTKGDFPCTSSYALVRDCQVTIDVFYEGDPKLPAVGAEVAIDSDRFEHLGPRWNRITRYHVPAQKEIVAQARKGTMFSKKLTGTLNPGKNSRELLLPPAHDYSHCFATCEERKSLRAADGCVTGAEMIRMVHRTAYSTVQNRQKKWPLEEGKLHVVGGRHWLDIAGRMISNKDNRSALNDKTEEYFTKNDHLFVTQDNIKVERETKDFLPHHPRIRFESDLETDYTYDMISAAICQGREEHVKARMLLQLLATGHTGVARQEKEQLIDAAFLVTVFGVEANKDTSCFLTGVMSLELIADEKSNFLRELHEGDSSNIEALAGKGGRFPLASYAHSNFEGKEILLKAFSATARLCDDFVFSSTRHRASGEPNMVIPKKEMLLITDWCANKIPGHAEYPKVELLKTIQGKLDELMSTYYVDQK